MVQAEINRRVNAIHSAEDEAAAARRINQATADAMVKEEQRRLVKGNEMDDVTEQERERELTVRSQSTLPISPTPT